MILDLSFFMISGGWMAICSIYERIADVLVRAKNGEIIGPCGTNNIVLRERFKSR